jgi:hypothetical protein
MSKEPERRPTAAEILAEFGDSEPMSGWFSQTVTSAAVALDGTTGQAVPSGVLGGDTAPGGGTGVPGGNPAAERTDARPRIRRRRLALVGIRRRRLALVVAAVAAAVLVPLVVAQAQSGPGSKGHASAGAVTSGSPALVGVYSGPEYGFSNPISVVADDSHVWVLDQPGDGENGAVTELDARSGALVQTIKAAGYGLNQATGIYDDGTNVWVGDLDSVSEISAGSGSLERILRVPASANVHGWPAPLVRAGTQLWGVTQETCRPLCGSGDQLYATLMQFNASRGSYVRVLMRTHTQAPAALAGDGTHIWLVGSDFNSKDPQDGANGHDTAGSVTEFDADSGSQVWSAPATIYSDQQETQTAVDSVAYDDGRLWVANGQSVTELNASDGKPIRVLSGAQYQFTGQGAVTAAGKYVFVVNGSQNSVTEIDAATGAVAHTLTAARYHLDNPVGISVAGNRAWILNAPFSGTASVVELALSAS